MDKQTVLIGGAVVAAYFLLKGGIDKITGNTPEERQGARKIDQAATNTLSPWDPNFWRQGQASGHDVLIMTESKAFNLVRELLHTVGFMRDDFPRAMSVIKQMKTQSQLSYLADKFLRDQGKSLLSWMRGTIFPQDHFSDAEVGQMIDYVNKLPKYTP